MRISGILTYNGRQYVVNTPAFVEQTYPLLLFLHGGSGDGPTFRAQMNIGTTLGENYILVFPTATLNQDGFTGWNSGGPFNTTGVDDVAYLNSLIDAMILTGRVDPQRLNLVGHSNGGMMGYRLICEQPTRWKSLYSMSANLDPDIPNPDTFTGGLRETHGTIDDNVPILGGVGPAAFYPVDWPSSYVTTPSFTQVKNPGIGNLNPLVGFGHGMDQITAGLISQGTTLQLNLQSFLLGL